MEEMTDRSGFRLNINNLRLYIAGGNSSRAEDIRDGETAIRNCANITNIDR